MNMIFLKQHKEIKLTRNNVLGWIYRIENYLMIKSFL